MEANLNALARRLRRYSADLGAQEAIGSVIGRRLDTPRTARELVQEEQDRNRLYLAAELLKIRAEAGGYELVDEAQKCLAAATVLYPDVPLEEPVTAATRRPTIAELEESIRRGERPEIPSAGYEPGTDVRLE